jgi:hypothetical protein
LPISISSDLVTRIFPLAQPTCIKKWDKLKLFNGSTQYTAYGRNIHKFLISSLRICY